MLSMEMLRTPRSRLLTKDRSSPASSASLSCERPECTRTSLTLEALTQTLKSAMALVDVRVLDHVITSDEGALSMAEAGLL